jgi:hypothetical protein
MAKVQISTFKPRERVKRPGVHSKKGTSSLKTSKNYRKKKVGQGN